MKSILRDTAIHSVGLFVLPIIFEGFKVQGDLKNILIAGLVLTLLFYLVKPILSILTLPLNAITFGAFSFLINAIIFYLLAVLLPYISLTAFTFPGIRFSGFVIPALYLNTFFAYIVISLTFSGIVTGLKWVFER